MATDTDTLTRTERLIAWAALAIVLTMLNGCAWLLTDKHQVVVIERQNDTLQVTAVYYMAGDDYLLGLPAMMMRLTGLEPPAILQGTNATIDLRSAGELSGTHEGILVNATDQDIWYTPIVYGDEGSLPRNAPTEPARLQPDSAMRFLTKTHGEYQFGCKDKPGEKEWFSYSGGEGPKTAILGWITPTAPDACGTTQQGARTQADKPEQSLVSNATKPSSPPAARPHNTDPPQYRIWASPPSEEPLATCYRLWEDQVASRAKDGWMGSIYLAYELSEKYPSCFQGKNLETFPKFSVGTNGSEVQHRLCIEWGAAEYEKAWQANHETAATVYLEALARRTGDYCVRNGRPMFTTDKGRRPVYPSRDECNERAQGLAKQFVHFSNMTPLCFDELGVPRFSLAPFAGMETAKSKAMDACSRGFETAAQRYIEELREAEEQDDWFNPYLNRGGAARSFMTDNRLCFNDGTPRFSLSGPYSNHEEVRKVLEAEKRFYERLNKVK